MKLLFFSLGTILGSFFCLVADRLPQNQSLIRPRSHCTYCQQTLRPVEMIPLISIVKQRFRCVHCHHQLARRYFWCELIAGCLLVLFPPVTWINVWFVSWLSVNVILALIDIEYLIVEPRLFLSSSSLLLIAAILLQQPLYLWHPPVVLVAYLLLQAILPNSLGQGDLWLLTVWSLFLTGQDLLLLLVIASLGGICFFGYQKQKGIPQKEIPFVPFLTLGLIWVVSLANIFG